MKRVNERGNSMLLLVIVGAVGAFLFMRLAEGLTFLSRSERGIASNSDLTSLRNDIAIVLNSKSLCAKSGLPGLSMGPLLAPTPSPVPVALTFGSNRILAKAGVTLPLGTKRIAAFDGRSLEWIEGDKYLLNLVLRTEKIGRELSYRPSELEFHAMVSVDSASQLVSSCGGDGSIPEASPGASTAASADFSVSMADLKNYNDLLTLHCDQLVDQWGKMRGEWLFFMSACRRYCSGCTSAMNNCKGDLPGQGYQSGFASECNGTTNTALCVCTR